MGKGTCAKPDNRDWMLRVAMVEGEGSSNLHMWHIHVRIHEYKEKIQNYFWKLDRDQLDPQASLASRLKHQNNYVLVIFSCT